MKKAVLKTRDLCKTYISEGVSTHAVRNMNLEIYEKDFTVIMGNSGSGKSTLLYMLSGLESVTSGEVYFEEKRIDTLKEKDMANFRRKSIGFIYQGINLVANLSLFENISVPGYLVEKKRKKVEERAMELLEMMELANQAHRLPSQVSGGQQQRGAIARGLINSPNVLFADEPTGALNSSQGENVLDILSELNEKGQSIVMVTHDLKAATRADRILFIKDGKIDGELNLGKYDKNTAGEREQQIFTFLKSKGW
jgi:putative ABC transport system ATP-binding protein